MKAWIVGTVLVCAALAVAGLPPEAPGFAFGEIQRDAAPERLRARELREQVVVAQEALIRRRWVDSLAPLTRGAAELSAGFVVSAPPEALLQDGARDAFATVGDYVRTELVLAGVARPAVDLGLVLLPNSEGATGRAIRLRHESRVEWWAGEADGRAYCIVARLDPTVVGSSLRPGMWTLSERARVLGPCRLYAKHGAPGAAIERWMRGAGASLALRSTPARRELPAQDVRFFGMRTGLAWNDARFEACVRGSAESCRALMLEPPAPLADDETSTIAPRLVELGVPLLATDYYGSPASWSGGLQAGMLADLERRFGADAFGAFWRSSAPVTVAFRDAFGVDLESWVREWARSFEGASANLNVAPDAGEALLTLLYLALGVWLAVRVAWRRRAA